MICSHPFAFVWIIEALKIKFRIYKYINFRFSRAQIKSYIDTYKKFDVAREGLGIEELKKLMEHIGHPQTHVGLLQVHHPEFSWHVL